jgi:hypothetical protein
MRWVTGRIAVICLVGGAACTNLPPQPPTVDPAGGLHYTTSRTRQVIACTGRPIQLEANRTETRLTGPCKFLRITGSHNDVVTDILPGGTIEITGDNNDVTWREIGTGPRPNLVNRGRSNSFHYVASNP